MKLYISLNEAFSLYSLYSTIAQLDYEQALDKTNRIINGCPILSTLILPRRAEMDKSFKLKQSHKLYKTWYKTLGLFT